MQQITSFGGSSEDEAQEMKGENFKMPLRFF